MTTAEAAREVVKATFTRAGVKEFGYGRERFFVVQEYGGGSSAGRSIGESELGGTAKDAWIAAAAFTAKQEG